MKIKNITEAFSSCYAISVTIKGKEKVYSKNNKIFDSFMYLWEDLVSDSRQMPALGVSLHNETVKEKEKGVWIELHFDSEQFDYGMPFSSLLINVKENYYGFNLIRFYEGKYEGRCFYLDLDNKNMDELLNFLLSLN